ncbi:MAG: hypothetical protein HXX13_11920 [Bacteroidetes bacterium]|nr:hypothetical protein [Bacteroidota bacterium]
MKKITLSRIAAFLGIAAMSITTVSAQLNLGSECGCPPVGSRPTKLMSSLGVNANGELLASHTLTCDTVYTVDQKIYVPSGITLTVKPGVVVKGASASVPANATAVIVERGGKLIADGTQSCPIVFTSVADPMDGTYSLTNVGDWGGIVLLGIATNNLITTNVYSGGYNGVGFIEGFSAANSRDLYGAGDPLFPTNDDNDNSGTLRYVSIRHAGAILAIGNELNGLSLGSVGRGTTIEHLETIAAADDNIEFFGGTVNVKYCSVLFGDDDMFDWDLGWKGKGQFLFGMAGDSLTGLHTTDNGFEADADDDKKAPALRSHPVIYNSTLISNGHIKPAADNTGPAAIQAKELTEGEIYNSIFANFRSGLHVAGARSNATNKGDAYDNWTDTHNSYNSAGGNAIYHSLLVKNNTFIDFPTVAPNLQRFVLTKGVMVVGKNPPTSWVITDGSSDDLTQFTNDGNSVVSSVPGIDYNWSWNAGHTSYLGNPFHMTPTSNITSSITPPADGFFSVVNYRGAFDASKGSWLSDWALEQIPTSQSSNPTDLNNDGVTDINDFNIFVGKFGQPNI